MIQTLNDRFDDIAPTCFFYDDNDHKTSKEIGEILRKYYLPFDEIDARSFNSLNQFMADGTIGNGVHRFVHYISNSTNVFYYKFSYIGRFSLFNYPHDKPYGVQHADDLQYVFYVKHIAPLALKTDPENLHIERMTRIWESFAWTG